MNSQNASLYLHYFSPIILLKRGTICLITISLPIFSLRRLMFFKIDSLTSRISSFNKVSIIGINPEITISLVKLLAILHKTSASEVLTCYEESDTREFS